METESIMQLAELAVIRELPSSRVMFKRKTIVQQASEIRRQVLVDTEGYGSFVVNVYPSSPYVSTATDVFRGGRRELVMVRWSLGDNGRWEQVDKLLPSASNPLTTPIGEKNANRMLKRLRLIVPRSHREVILGDLEEEISAMRDEGYTEKQLCWYVCLQVFYTVAERLKPWNWVKAGAVAWLTGKVAGISWIARLRR